MYISFPKTTFNCPHCGREHDDVYDFYFKRCNKNKTGITSVNCMCDNKFQMTYNYKGDPVSFKFKYQYG